MFPCSPCCFRWQSLARSLDISFSPSLVRPLFDPSRSRSLLLTPLSTTSTRSSNHVHPCASPRHRWTGGRTRSTRHRPKTGHWTHPKRNQPRYWADAPAAVGCRDIVLPPPSGAIPMLTSADDRTGSGMSWPSSVSSQLARTSVADPRRPHEQECVSDVTLRRTPQNPSHPPRTRALTDNDQTPSSCSLASTTPERL